MSKIKNAILGKTYSEKEWDFLQKEGFDSDKFSEDNVYVKLGNDYFDVTVYKSDESGDVEIGTMVGFNQSNFYERYDELCEWIRENKGKGDV